MGDTRPVFAGLSHGEVIAWYGLIVVSTAIFVWGVAMLVAKYRSGRRQPVSHLVSRAGQMCAVVFSHRWIRRRDRLAGAGHLLVFYGFLALFAGTTILGIQVDITKPIFRWTFWEGGFYDGYKAALDLAGLLLLAGLGLLSYNRWARRAERLDYRRPDRDATEVDRRLYRAGDVVFVVTLAGLALTGFLLEGSYLAASNPSNAAFSPVGWVLMRWFRAVGLSGGSAALAHHVLWWFHGVAALVFVSSIPFTKAVHMIVAPANVTVRDETAGKRLVQVPAEAASADVGYGAVTDLSWLHLLSLDACTKCGKCTAACPAAAGGYPLSPRDLILDLREVAEASRGAHGALGVRPGTGLGLGTGPAGRVLGEVVRPESMWSCTQCMACVEICPVGIEHVPIINQFRRRLVEEGEMEPLLQSTLETIYESGNSFGEARRKRSRWTDGLDFPVKDARKEEVDVLWFLGDYASFDPRSQRVSRAIAEMLVMAGVDFGILHEAERTAGCDVRRVGEEGLFSSLAEENIKAISSCSFERLLSSDPHSYHTLKNEYPAFGGSWPVMHHSELLDELLSSKRLRPQKPLGYRVTYHDPCMLGRYNGVYDAPRRVLEAIGLELVEMPRNRDNSLCCGAGGGRIWMKEKAAPGSRRTSEQRIDEATALGGIDYFVVSCPKDVTMYSDAIKTSGHDGEIELKELAELVYESLGLGKGAPDDAQGVVESMA